ncbi:MAG: RNA polymerase factor sigma-54 [Desulfoplanes sp.]|nr:RNA polymerase factor sigma-54 [Desulfoplanes sp.]
MALELRQNLKLTQQLVMTPQLQQAIKLLQLSRMELLDVVQEELLENPMLDEDVLDPDLEEKKNQEEPQNREEENSEFAGEEKDFLKNAEWEDYLGDFSSTGKQVQAYESEAFEEISSYEGRVSAKPSLEGHLLWQLHLSSLTEEDCRIGELIINNLSTLGYLETGTEDLAAQLDVDEESVEAVLKVIQNFDPVGVAARTPQECLLVQLDAVGDKDPLLRSLITDHLEDIEQHRYKPLLRKFKIGKDDLKEYLDVITALDPMPGASFGNEIAVYVSPDAYVYKYEDDFVIVLNDDGLPKLQLNPFYMETLEANANKEDSSYLHEKMRAAQWLMKSLQQRQRTLYKVVESIVRFQKDFFEHGPSQLKPLILKDVAADIEMHESTVSRITTSKYVATPHGIFPLKYFFNSALDLDDGTQVGSESVKVAIKKIIDSEDTKKPYSDEKISQMLKDQLDVNIARRTVAKYRSALNIESSSRRKTFF